MTADGPRLRLGIIGIVTLSLFAALFARLWFLQVLAADEYQLAAEINRVRVVTEPAPRGRILDRDGEVLVENRASNVVAIDRSKLDSAEERKRLLERLSPIVGVPVQRLANRLDDQRFSRYTPVPVVEDVPEEIMVRLSERSSQFPAVQAKRVAVRHYPHGNLAAHLLGYVGEINGEELSARGDDYELGDQIGKAGVEQVYEDDLRGVDGELRIEVDAENQPIRVLERTEPEQGHDVVLSVDLDAQRVAEQALAEGLAAARGRKFVDSGKPLVADAGAVVVLDAKEGSLVAMASYPTFDPAQLVNGITTAEAQALFGDENTAAPFTNRAVSGQYAPGSTWKLVSALAALRQGLITPQTTVNDRGTYTIPNCVRGCLKRNAGSTPYGLVDVRRALTVSSDVFFYGIGANAWMRRGDLGETVIQDTARSLGFGVETDIPLPAEQDGRIPTPASRAQLHAEKPEAFPNGDWYIGDNVNLAIGQGEVLVTPIQLANAYATVATGGTRFAPNLGLRVQDQQGEVLRRVEPRVVDQQPIDPAHRQPIVDGLRGVTASRDGTAWYSFVGFPLDQYPIIGKTGTAQAKPKQDTALFAAVAPATDPRYAVAVVMEQAGFGSTSAAPVARRVLGQLSGLEPADPTDPLELGRLSHPGARD